MSAHFETRRIIQSLCLQEQRLRQALPMALSQTMFLPDLPPLGLTGSEARVSRAQLEAFAALYYHAEVEATGLLVVAELLAEERDSLNVRSRELYQALQGLADAMRGEWYDADRRALMFENVFRFGATDDFRRTLDQLAGNLEQFAKEHRGFGSPRPLPQLEMSFQNLLRDVSSRSHMGLERASSILNRSIKIAVELFSHAELLRMFRANSMWGLVEAVVSDQVNQRDIPRAIERAEAGAPMIAWCATRINIIEGRSSEIVTHVTNDATLLRYAARWKMGASDQPQPSASRGGWA